MGRAAGPGIPPGAPPPPLGAQGWSHGPVGAVVAAWPAVSLAGSYELLVWLIRVSGSADREPSAEYLCAGAACCAAARPVPAPAIGWRAPRREKARHVRPGVAALRVRPQGSRPSPPPDSVTLRRLRPALSMTRRWPRTGSACRPATRCRNAGSPGCSDAHPAAGREPESLMQDKQRRSQTRRTPWSRPTPADSGIPPGRPYQGLPPGSSGTTWPGRSACAQIECRLVVKGFRAPAGAGLHQGVDEIGGLEIRQLQVLQPGPRVALVPVRGASATIRSRASRMCARAPGPRAQETVSPGCARCRRAAAAAASRRRPRAPQVRRGPCAARR